MGLLLQGFQLRLMANKFVHFGTMELLRGKRDTIVCYKHGILYAKSIKEVAHIDYQLDSSLVDLFFEHRA
jgi:sRNA-binding regulator protein Hfq